MFGITNIRTRIGSWLNGLPRDVGWSIGTVHDFFKDARGARILLYHGVCVNDPLRFNTLFVSLKTFESQLKLYKKYFNLISLDDFYEQRFAGDRFNICLSFDDGFANNHKYVLPLIERYEVPAAFFLTAVRNDGYDILWNDLLSISFRYGPRQIICNGNRYVKGKDNRYTSVATGEGLIDILRRSGFEQKAEVMKLLGSIRNNVDEDYWLQLTTDQIKTLSASKWATIGSHGYYHNDLAKIPVSLALDELGNSKLYLENITGKEIKAVAFPYGSYSKPVVAQAKQAGYTQLLATDFLDREDSHDKTMRERLTINPFISNINQMHANITGNYN